MIFNKRENTSFMKKILQVFRIKNKKENHWNDIYIPKYSTDLFLEQDRNQSIFTSDGKYDLTRFSPHEISTIKRVLATVDKKYPDEYKSLGLANESYCIKYKPRYVLFEMIIQMYSKSQNYIDKLAVALAYESKGAHFRKQAINYFEQAEEYIEIELMRDFVSYMPLYIYTTFSKLYEQEHDYSKAILYLEKAKAWGAPKNTYFDDRINELLEKINTPSKIRNMKIPESKIAFERDVEAAAKYFIEHKDIPNTILVIPNKNKGTRLPKKKTLSQYEVERYAAMCNAYLEHEDEMKQYKVK